ncbi:MAG: hypothetical protein JWM47_3912, partial [Acidimicrobiales bacterium]|nr:hypothetical protein [Acidimicrobiales bacterium]
STTAAPVTTAPPPAAAPTTAPPTTAPPTTAAPPPATLESIALRFVEGILRGDDVSSIADPSAIETARSSFVFGAAEATYEVVIDPERSLAEFGFADSCGLIGDITTGCYVRYADRVTGAGQTVLLTVPDHVASGMIDGEPVDLEKIDPRVIAVEVVAG